MKNYILFTFALFSVQLAFAQNNRSKAEVFIQVEDRGSLTINLDNESITSSKGRFRFFDIYSAAPVLSIVQDGRILYNKRIEVRGDERSIFIYNLKEGLSFYKSLPIYRNGKYALDNFDQFSEAYNTGIVPPRAESSDAFQSLFNAVKKASSDDTKMDVIQINSVRAELSSTQLISLLKLINNEDKKLQLAKSSYMVIKDPQNFYTIEEAFSFLSKKDDFINYTKTQSSTRYGSLIRNADFERLKEQVKRESFDDGRTSLIQNTLKNSYINANQLAELLKLYSFEDAKLRTAKLLCHQIVDKQRYYTVVDTFKFISTKNQFLDFIKGYVN